MLASTSRYPGYDTYRPGNAWFICDRCSQRHRRSAMLTEWTGLKVDAKCLDPRPPQMTPPDVYPEGIPFADARMPQDNPDRLTDDTALQSVSGGIGVQFGQSMPAGQNQGPGAISPLSVTESVPVVGPSYLVTESGIPIVTEGGAQLILQQIIGTPSGPNDLADDVTFLTGRVFAT